MEWKKKNQWKYRVWQKSHFQRAGMRRELRTSAVIESCIMTLAGFVLAIAAEQYPSSWPWNSSEQENCLNIQNLLKKGIENRLFLALKETPPDSLSMEPLAEAASSMEADLQTEIEKADLNRAVRLNMAYIFPEGTQDPMDSYAGQVFDELTEKDSRWLSEIYSLPHAKPMEVAQKLGRTLENGEQIENWKNVTVSFYDGDGNPIVGYSNAKEILSMASVYAYYQDITTKEGFSLFADDLWNRSHQYQITVSDVYYCDGTCLQEGKKEETLPIEESGANLTEDETDSYGKKEISGESEGESEIGPGIESEGESEIGPGIESEGENEIGPGIESEGENEIGPDIESESESEIGPGIESEGESEIGPGIESEGESEIGPDIETNGANDYETQANGRTGKGEESQGEIDEAPIKGGKAEEDGGVRTSDGGRTEESGDRTDSDEAAESGEASKNKKTPEDGTETDRGIPIDNKAAENKGETQEEGMEASEEPAVCPGHMDLDISISINGLKEKENSLFEKDSIGTDASHQTDQWRGWDSFRKLYAKAIEQQDWYEAYGLTVSTSMFIRSPLTDSEISYYMGLLPENTSENRKKIVREALGSVGCIPYYWGGKPGGPGFEANNFGTIVSPDKSGRRLRGLDCSGWIYWLYWTALGQPSVSQSTSGLISDGWAIERSQLQPGDVIVRTGENSHVYLFLAWAEDDAMYLIHETGGMTNNVTVSCYNVNWPYYRNLLEE